MTRRRAFLGTALGMMSAGPVLAALRAGRWDAAVEVLDRAVASKQVESAVLHVSQRGETFTRPFGKAGSKDAMFLLGSISKPINVTALMALFDRGLFRLDDRVAKFLPKFQGENKDGVTIRHLLTHTSGLPDQLADNSALRKRHAPLSEFVASALRTPLEFAPGSRYQYSSMGILLATHIGELLGGASILELVDRNVFRPLGMEHSAQGLGRFRIEDMVVCQPDGAAPESGGGDAQSKEWDWNSPYWRKLGAPWGGTHSSAPDIARFLDEFLGARGRAVKPETARLMVRNQNPAGFTPRGLGFAVGSPGCSERTFGHTGSTGTICWADPARDAICVVLTSLPARAVKPHPRDLAAERVAVAVDR